MEREGRAFTLLINERTRVRRTPIRERRSGGGDVTAVNDDESTFSFSFLLSRNWISLEEQRSTAQFSYLASRGVLAVVALCDSVLL